MRPERSAKVLKVKIPVHNQGSEAVGGIYIAQLSVSETAEHIDKLGTHRDEYYVFFILAKGKVRLQCDMQDIEINATCICMIKPFQIHTFQHITPDATGYFISVAPFLIPDSCAHVFQNLPIAKQFQKTEGSQKKDLMDNISLLLRAFTDRSSSKTHIINGLFDALVYRITNIYHASEKSLSKSRNQTSLIYANFKKLITASTFLEGPSYFAKKLNISTSHLNDCVNATTGKSVTWWLQNSMIIEAQRLLYYTENDVKEIAFSLGFEDHTYFSRLFKKITGETPLAFRKKFRE